MSEKEKSQASDSFKRACFNWGIGRELYTAPFIWLPAGKVMIECKEKQNKEKHYYCNDRFAVSSIGYSDDREINALVIVNDKGKTVYELKQGKAKKQEPEAGNKVGITGAQMERLQKELKRTGVELQAVQDRYQIKEPERMSEELYKKVMAALSKTKSMEAA